MCPGTLYQATATVTMPAIIPARGRLIALVETQNWRRDGEVRCDTAATLFRVRRRLRLLTGPHEALVRACGHPGGFNSKGLGTRRNPNHASLDQGRRLGEKNEIYPRTLHPPPPYTAACSGRKPGIKNERMVPASRHSGAEASWTKPVHTGRLIGHRGQGEGSQARRKSGASHGGGKPLERQRVEGTVRFHRLVGRLIRPPVRYMMTDSLADHNCLIFRLKKTFDLSRLPLTMFIQLKARLQAEQCD